MTRLFKFLNLPSSERSLLVKAAILLWGIRLGLWLFSFQTLQRHLARVMQTSPESPDADSSSPDRPAWAVRAASRYVPKATCLTQALAAQVLLGRRGHTSRLHIGVTRSMEKEFEAHAWLQCEGKVVIGDSEIERFTPLLASEAKKPWIA